MPKPTREEIEDVLNQCAEAEEEGRSKYPGMTYEQGVEYTLKWLDGNADNPMED